NDLETFFAQSLADLLPSDKLEIVADNLGTVAPGGTTTEKFLGAANDLNMTIALSLSGHAVTGSFLPFQLKAPDGMLIDLAPHTTFNGQTSLTSLKFPLSQGGASVAQKGEWQLVIRNDLPAGPPLKYHLIVMADNPTIATNFIIDTTDAGTGETTPLRVKLT